MASVQTKPFTVSGAIEVADTADAVMGVAYTGFTAVTVYNGSDNTGDVVFAGGAGPMTILANSPIRCQKGVYVEAAGTGVGSILV